MSDDNELFKWSWTLMSLPIAYIIRRIGKHEDKTDDVEKEIADHKLHVATEYSKTDDVKDMMENTVQPMKESLKRIDTNVDKIFEKLDNLKQ